MAEAGANGSATWPRLQALVDPTRRAVFDAVRAARHPVTRDEVAAALEIGRSLAAFHLDRLAEAGLLEVSYARPPGRSGPGAGRPAKRYDASAARVGLSIPPRRDAVVGGILARAIAERPARADRRAAELAYDEGRRLGREHQPAGRRPGVAATLEAVAEALRHLGYEPQRRDREIRLCNCPFHEVRSAAPELVCGLNERLIAGLLDGLAGSERVTARLDPGPDRCCVTISADPPR